MEIFERSELNPFFFCNFDASLILSSVIKTEAFKNA